MRLIKILLVTSAILCFCLPVHAEIAPAVYIKDLKIDIISGNAITGQFKIRNAEDYYLSGLGYEIKLFQNQPKKQLELVDAVVSGKTLVIGPNTIIAEPLNYSFPKNINSGDYTLRVQAITERGTGLGWADQTVSLKGVGGFLGISSLLSRVIYNGAEHFALEGVNINPKENVIAVLSVTNTGEKTTVVPNIKIFQRQVNMPVAKEYQESPITFAKGEAKKIELALPKLEDPESYLAQIGFFKNNEPVSGMQYFRWVVRGAGGKIINVTADKDYAKAGDNLSITVQSIGPADDSDIGAGKINVEVLDKDSNLVGKISKDISLNSALATSVLSIKIKNDLVLPQVQTKLLDSNENILDQSVFVMPLSSAEAKQLEAKIARDKIIRKFLAYLLLVLAVSGILIAIFLILRNKIKSK